MLIFVNHTHVPASVLIAVEMLSPSLVAGVTISTAKSTSFATLRYLQIVRFMAIDCNIWNMGARDA